MKKHDEVILLTLLIKKFVMLYYIFSSVHVSKGGNKGGAGTGHHQHHGVGKLIEFPYPNIIRILLDEKSRILK